MTQTPPAGRPEAPARVESRPSRAGLAVVTVFFVGALPLSLSSPWLAGLLLVPVACAVWVLRARVTATTVGLEVCNGLATSRVVWDHVEGFDVRRYGWTRLLRREARPLLLTGLQRSDLRRVIAVGELAAGRTP